MSGSATEGDLETPGWTISPDQDQSNTLFVQFTWAAIIVGFIGVVGNGFVLLIILTERKQGKVKASRLQNPFLINQTCVDFVTSVFMIGTYCYKLSPRRYFWGRAGLWTCALIESEQMLWIFLTASAFSLEAITIERLIKIVYPIMHRNAFGAKKVAWMICFTWLFPIVWQVALTFTTTYIQDGACYSQARWPNPTLLQLHVWSAPILTYFSPVLLFGLCYGHILYCIHRRNVQVMGSSNTPQPNTLSQAQINVTLTMVLVCACFIILWSPIKIYYLLATLGHLNYQNFYNDIYYFMFLIIAFLNSIINPLIYVFKLNEFKARAKELLGMSMVTSTEET